MSQKLEGLWLGGEISREAAEFVERAIRNEMERGFASHLNGRQHAELVDLSNAIRAQIQKLPPPPKPLCDLI